MTALATLPMMPSFDTPAPTTRPRCSPPLSVVLALLLWLLNRQLFAVVWPSWWTDKLGTATALAVFPLIPYAASDLWRERCGAPPPSPRTLLLWVLATGVALTALKTLSPAADAYHAVLAMLEWPTRALRAWSVVAWSPCSTAEDPSDLLTLPALLVPWGVARREQPQRREPVTGRAAWRR